MQQSIHIKFALCGRSPLHPAHITTTDNMHTVKKYNILCTGESFLIYQQTQVLFKTFGEDVSNAPSSYLY